MLGRSQLYIFESQFVPELIFSVIKLILNETMLYSLMSLFESIPDNPPYLARRVPVLRGLYQFLPFSLVPPICEHHHLFCERVGILLKKILS